MVRSWIKYGPNIAINQTYIFLHHTMVDQCDLKANDVENPYEEMNIVC